MDFSTNASSFEISQLVDDLSAGDLINSFASQSRRLGRPRPSSDLTTNALPRAIEENWVKLKQSGLSSKFYSRLLRLALDRFNPAITTSSKEKIRASSLSDFLEFWARIKTDAVEPELSVSKDGSIFVEWFKSNNQRLDIKFAEGAVIFGLFNQGKILEGAETKEQAAQILQDHHARPFRWR